MVKNGFGSFAAITYLKLVRHKPVPGKPEREMAIAREGSRRIVVDGVTYRWRANGDNVGYGLVDVAIALDQATGTTLLFCSDEERVDTLTGYSHPVITPARISEVIRLALGCGWRADEPGKPFDLWPHLPAEYQGPMNSFLRPGFPAEKELVP
jgi:hypothetical protein